LGVKLNPFRDRRKPSPDHFVGPYARVALRRRIDTSGCLSRAAVKMSMTSSDGTAL
jgi:hypothetical protein